ncbi:RloB family protein [Dactylosporangium sp. NPDC051541]|uniref:RloB family protein n=1 Tax=Dactylosporangium sp. NPDC051541 TaxID=3363977 RepID=UPI00379F1DA5
MTRSSRPLARRAGTATEAKTIAIVCEGVKTEDIYFNGIRKQYRLATARINFVGLGADPLTVVRHAEQLQADYDYTWAVFDVEAAGPHAQRHLSLDAAVARATRAGIGCAISHPCFELWPHRDTALRNADQLHQQRIQDCPRSWTAIPGQAFTSSCNNCWS